MKHANYAKINSSIQALALSLVCLAMPAAAKTISYTNTFAIDATHSLSSILGVATSSSFTNTGSASLGMFNSTLGALNSASIRVTTVNPTFSGTVSVLLAGVNVAYSQTQDLRYSLSNLGFGATGATAGPVNQLGSVAVGNRDFTISTTPAAIGSIITYTNSSDLAKFSTNNDSGSFSVNGELDSFYNLGVVSVLSTMQGTGAYPVQVVVTYDYGTTLTVVPALVNGTTNFILSFPTNAVGFKVETTTDINMNSWTPLTYTATVSNGNFVIQVPEVLPYQFFRLHAQ
jgi:hypothetical protein